MSNKKISELVKATSSNATDEFVLSRGATNVSIQAQYISALSASYALTASYAVSSSVEIKQEITSSYAETASYAYSTDILSGSASDARNELVTKISGSSIAPIAALSGSLTTTDQAISSSVATLSGSASDARNELVTKISGSSIASIAALSASLTLTNQAISSSVATLSGSAAAALTTYSASTATYLSSSISTATVLTSSFSETSSFSNTSSYSLTSVSASHAVTASYAISSSHEITHEISSSYSQTSSYAVTASYALNGGGGGSTNPTNNFIPLRSDATTFIDSPISVQTGSISYQPSALVTTGTLSVPPSSTFAFSNLGNGASLYVNGADFFGFTIGNRIRITDTVGTAEAIISGFNEPTEVPFIGLTPIPGVDYSGAPTLSNANGTITFTELEEVTIPGLTHITGSTFGESISGSFTGSFLGNLEGSSSYAVTASYALNGGGVTYSSTYVTANITAEENKVYVFEQSTPYTLTLPLSPSGGDSIFISNRSTISTNSVNGNGEKIMGDTQNLNLDIPTASFRLMYTTGNQGWVVLGALGSNSSIGSVGYDALDNSFKTRASNVTLSSGTTSAIIDFDSSSIFEITTPTDTTATTLNFDNAEIGMSKMVLIVNQGTAGSGTITLGQTTGTGTFIRASSDDIVRTASITNYLQITCIGESGDDRTFVYTVGTAQ
jgi:hypothetical protein